MRIVNPTPPLPPHWVACGLCSEGFRTFLGFRKHFDERHAEAWAKQHSEGDDDADQ